MSNTFKLTQTTWRYYKNVFSNRHQKPEWWAEVRLILIPNVVIEGGKQNGLGKP